MFESKIDLIGLKL